MSYQGQRLNTLGRIRQALQRMIFGRGTYARRRTEFWGADTDIDYESEMGGADNSDIVSSLVGWKQDVFPEAVLGVREKDADGKYQPVEDNPMMPLLQRPNPLYQGLDLWKGTIWDYNVDGNAYWWVIRNGMGDITELHFLPAYMMEPGYDINQKLEDRFWLYTPYDLTYNIPAEQVIHFRDGIDREDVRLGCSRLKNLYREMYTDSVAADMVAILLRNRAVFGPIITPEESEHDQGNISEMKTYIQDKFTGSNRGEPLVLGAPTKVTSFGYDSNDSDVTEIRYMAEERISAALNVPSIVTNLGSGLRRSTYSNVESAREMGWENGMLPMLRHFSATLTEYLMPLVEGTEMQEFHFDISDVRVLQEDKMRAAQRLRLGLSAGFITVAEAREEMGMAWEESDQVYLRSPGLVQVDAKTGEPVVTDTGDSGLEKMQEPGKDADGDGIAFESEEDSGDVDMGRAAKLPNTERASARATLARLSKLLEDDEARELLKGTSQIIEDAWTSPNGNGRHAEVLEAPVAVIARAEADLPDNVRRLNAAFNAGVERATTVYGEQLEEFFERVAREIYDGYEGSITAWVTFAVESEENLAYMAGEIDAVFNEVNLNGPTRDVQMRGIFDALHTQVLDEVVAAVNTSLGTSVMLPDHRMRQVIADGGMRVGLVDLDRQARDAVFRSLATSRSQGMGVDAAARLLREHVEAGPFTNGGKEYRAKLIARTESKHAQRVSALELYDEAGWKVMMLDGQLGDASDEDCKARNGRVITVQEGKLEMNSPITHPNCTLTFVAVVSE